MAPVPATRIPAASRQPASHGSTLRVAGWAVLAVGTLRLALPQRDVRQIDLVGDLQAPAAGGGPEIGRRIRDGGRPWPAYCLDAHLRLQLPAPAQRRICVFFGLEDGVRGILCDRVWSLAADADLVIEPLPGCFEGARSPATGLARFEQHVVLVTDGGALAAYLVEFEEAGDGRR